MGLIYKIEKKEKVIIGSCALVAVIAGILHYAHANEVVAFGVTGVARRF